MVAAWARPLQARWFWAHLKRLLTGKVRRWLRLRSHVQDQHRVRDSGSRWPRAPTTPAPVAGVAVAVAVASEQPAREGKGRLRRACAGRACLFKPSPALVFQQPHSLYKSLFFRKIKEDWRRVQYLAVVAANLALNVTSAFLFPDASSFPGSG